MIRPIALTSLCLLAATVSAADGVKITAHGTERVSVEIDGRPFTDFYIGPETNKPYLHPLRSASGKVVTRAYPMRSDVPGESHDHPHHRGLWFTHGDVNGYDFWGNEPSQESPKKGKVELKSLDAVKSGRASGVITATFNWNDSAGKTLLTEKRMMTFYSKPDTRVIDFDILLTPLTTVKFGDTKEGTFAIRLAAGLEEPQRRSLPEPKRTGTMVNAEGKTGEKEVWGKRSAWVDYFGELEGEKLGIAIFDHPENPRHPTWWHARSYGLFAANMFGLHDFENDKTKDGSMTLAPGKAMRLRYRVTIHPGDVHSAGIAGLYQAYSNGK